MFRAPLASSALPGSLQSISAACCLREHRCKRANLSRAGGGGGGTAVAGRRLVRRLGPRQCRILASGDAGLETSSSSSSSSSSGSTAATSTNGSSNGSSKVKNGTTSGNGAGGSSKVKNGSTSSKGRRRQRQPRITPLPFWCDGVSVVGLPDDQIVFCFQTADQAAAVARKRLRPEAAFGGAAVKLAFVASDRAQAILDRWQYAVAQRELAELNTRPLLWWRYESARKSRLKEAGGTATDGEAEQPPAGSGGAGSKGADAAGEALTRRQARKAARLAKVVGKGSSSSKGAGGRPPAEAAEQQQQQQWQRHDEPDEQEAEQQEEEDEWEQQEGGSARTLEFFPGGRLGISPSVMDCGWEMCTVRGRPDGSLIYKFGSFEPLPELPPWFVLDSSEGGDSDGEGDAEASADGGGREGSREERRLRSLQQQLLRSQEGVAWSSTLRLGVKFRERFAMSYGKLQAFVEEWRERQDSSVALNWSEHPSYDKALVKAQRQAAAAGLLPAPAAGGPAGVVEREEGQEEAADADWRQQRRQQEYAQLAASEQAGTAEEQQEEQEEQADTVGEQAGEQEQQQQAEEREDQQAEQQARAAEGATSSSIGEDLLLEPQPVALASAEEQDWQSELLPPPERRAQSDQQRQLEQQQQHGQQEAGDSTMTPAASPSAAAPSAPLARIVQLAAQAVAALAAAFSALRAALHWRALAAAGRAALLALYRRVVPLWLRRRFWPSWPPQWREAHVSPSVAALLDDRISPEQAGFDSAGRTAAPLADLKAWQVERLTLCPVGSLDLYRAAFTHKSALLPEDKLSKSFERLEFLGDSVLGLTCRSLLMERRPASDEGEMTQLQSMLVSRAGVARYAAWLGIDRYLLLDVKGLREAVQHSPTILGDVFEALLGALFLDQGFDAASKFCTRVLDAAVDWDTLEPAKDWKGMLSRYAWMQQKPQPRYSVRTAGSREYKAGLALPWWKVEVHFQGSIMGRGAGFDKRKAEQLAAREALRSLQKADPSLEV